MQDRSTTSLGAELAGAAHEFRHARHRAKLLLNALRGRVAKNNAAGDEQDHRMEMARHINLAGSAKSKPEWKKHMDAAAHHQRMVNDLQAHRTRVQQGHESRLRGSLPDYKPHELKMYLGLLESGDTHGVAVHTIKGERLMDAYKQRGTKNSAQKKPVPSWKNDLERIHSNYVVHHHELEGQKVEDVHARIVGLGFRRVSKIDRGGSKRYGQLPETVHHYRHPDGRLMFMHSVGSGAMYMTEHVPWAKNAARPTKQSELWRNPFPSERPHAGMSDDELHGAIETARTNLRDAKLGSDVVKRMQHPEGKRLANLLSEKSHREYLADIRASRIRRHQFKVRFPKQWPVKNNATNMNADQLSAKAHDLTHQIKDIGDASSKINAHSLALDAHMSAQEAHRSAIRELQARIAHHRTAIGAHEHKIIHHDRHISLLTRLPVVKNSAASDVREQSESVIQTIRAGKSSPWGPWKKHSIHQGKTIYVREAKTGGGRSLWMAMKEGHLPSEWRPKFTDVNAAVDHAKYVTNSTGVHPATLSEAAEDASDKAWKTDDRYDHVLAMRAHLKAEKAHTNLIKQHHHAMTAGLHNDRVKQLGRTKNSSPAWTPPIGFTHTRCANGSTVGAFTGSPMISGFSKSQTAQNAGAGHSDSWEKQHGGFTNQDHAREAAREFAFSSDAARDLSLVPTHHNHEGANFPALEVPSRRRMQVLKARMDQFGVKYKDVGNNTVAVWHPSMKMVANSGDQSDIDMDKRSWAATRAAYKRTERAYQVGGFTEHHNAMKSHLEAAELHKKSYPHDSEKIIERRKNLVNEHNAEADLHENWLKRHFGKRMGSNSSAPVAQNVHRASGEQAPDLEKSLRAYEAAHKVWFSTPVHTDAGKAAKKSLDEARTAYEDAVRYHRPGTIIL